MQKHIPRSECPGCSPKRGASSAVTPNLNLNLNPNLWRSPNLEASSVATLPPRSTLHAPRSPGPVPPDFGFRISAAPLAALVLLSLFLGAAGCVTSGPRAKPAPKEPSSKARVDELDLVTMPVAVNLESKLGLSGIQVKIYASDSQRPKPHAITDGTLEILMFEGLVGDSFDQTNRCRHLWSFPARDLLTSAVTTTVGTGYLFPLAWGKDRPRADKITVVARYLPPQGPVIYSAPSYISIPPPPSTPPSPPPAPPPPKK